MNIRKNQIKYTEVALISFVWLVLLLTPILFREDNNNPIWRSVANQLEILVPLSLLFLINRFVLVPKFLFKGKIKFYIFLLLGIIIILALGSHIYDDNSKIAPPQKEMGADKKIGPPQDSPPGRDDSRPPQPGQRQQGQRPQRQRPQGQRQQGQRQPRPVPPFANFLIFSFLVVGFDTGLRSGLRWIDVENEKVKLERENVSNQLALLKTQVSPHFFMNTLNNIHSLVDSNTEEAKKAIIKLSKMMRYLLYETETEKTTLKKEIEFLESYVNLMKLRFTEKVRISLNLPGVIPDAAIPPFLFTSFIENAFKHGVSYKNESFVTIDLIPGKERLLFTVKNSKTEKSQMNEFSGIGIENTRKRLALLYGDKYHLDIIDNEYVFTVNLSIPL
ncbi:MAG: histidine kinase [Bacteroidetes bacterium]|nr:histidine kinase [Bacteroidota bacterium]